jgi:hypothetical protein
MMLYESFFESDAFIPASCVAVFGNKGAKGIY